MSQIALVPFEVITQYFNVSPCPVSLRYAHTSVSALTVLNKYAFSLTCVHVFLNRDAYCRLNFLVGVDVVGISWQLHSDLIVNIYSSNVVNKVLNINIFRERRGRRTTWQLVCWRLINPLSTPPLFCRYLMDGPESSSESEMEVDDKSEEEVDTKVK